MKISKSKLRQIIKEELEKVQEQEEYMMGGQRVEADMVYFWSILEPCPAGDGACSDGEREYVYGENEQPMVVAAAGPGDRINWATTRAQAQGVFGQLGYDSRDDNMRLLMSSARAGKNVRAMAPRDFELIAEKWWKPHSGT